MVLPEQDHIARTCKGSSVDQLTGRATPASFVFRLNEAGSWKDTYLSVNWLEKLHPIETDLSRKLARLREFLAAPHEFPVMRTSKTSVLAAIKVATIHAGPVAEIPTVLQCRYEPRGDGDAHAGIHPSPGVDHWPAVGDAPEHLAIQLFLFQSICHTEPAQV